ncbi:MAG: nuclear transport factor 2 family protein [Acidobacteria bacterium]|jgi:hypothetical protein|nr:nuclear transport factor 2 family protein [Acidobacteriota bacterium]
MKKLALSVLVLTFSLVSLAQTSNPNDTLIANSKAVANAMLNKDVAFLRQTLADDFHAIGSEGHLHGKGEVLEIAQSGALHELMPYNLHVLAVDENSSIVTYDCIVHMPEGDEGAAPRYQHISDLWVKQGEQWKLKFQQATPLRSID